MTEREPTKSGVVGFIACALGRRRTEPIDDLAALHFGIRIDQPGELLRDYHTAKTFDGKQAFVSDRYYLSDAVFVVGIEGDDDLLDKIDGAIRNPAFPLFLGRRSCPPSEQVSLRVRKGVTLREALEKESWHASDRYKKTQPDPVCLNMVLDGEVSNANVLLRRDNPESYDQAYRKYGFREISYGLKTPPIDNPFGKSDHDPMEVL
jgi:CRISPR system Cascade subunit CasD